MSVSGCCENGLTQDRILIRDLQFAYPGRGRSDLVLERVSMSVPQGAIVVIVGDNGVGKSTLLRLLAGTLQPATGTVTVFGKPPDASKIAFVWQETSASLFPWLSVGENIGLPWRLAGIKRPDRRGRVLELCRTLGFDLDLDTQPYRLSGGEQQRVAILRALASRPQVLLMDEPFSNLSFDGALELLQYIQQIHQAVDLTTIIVSHSPEFSVFVADFLVPFRSRPVVFDDASQIIVRSPYPRPRPTQWMFEESFHEQVQILKSISRLHA